MKNNQKGFTLVELIGVIAISSIIIAPLLFSLVNNFEVNTRQMQRSAAATISQASILAFQDVYFRDITDIIDQAILNEDMYLALNGNNCNVFGDTESSTFDTVINYFGGDITNLDVEEGVQPRGGGAKGVCDAVFSLNVLEEQFSPEDFIVVIAPYAIESTQETLWQTALTNDLPGLNLPIPPKVLDELDKVTIMPVGEEPPSMMYRIIVYIQYSDRDSDTIVRSTLLTPKWAPPSPN